LPRKPPELKKRTIERYKVLLSIKAVAEETGLSESYVGRVIREYRNKEALAGVAGSNCTEKTTGSGEKIEQHKQGEIIPNLGITREELKIIYTAFLAGKAQAKIIAEYGYDPQIVEREYGRFNRQRGSDISEIQAAVLDYFAAGYHEELIPYNNLFKKRGFLRKSEFLEAIEIANRIEDEAIQDLILNNSSEPAPEGWVKLTSRQDGRVIAVVRTDDELNIIKYYNGTKNIPSYYRSR